MKDVMTKAGEVFRNISWAMILIFTFIFPLKFGLPYLSNVMHMRPILDFSDAQEFITQWIFHSWPNELAMIVVILAFLFFIISIALHKGRTMRLTWLDGLFVLFLILSLPSVLGSHALKFSLDHFLIFCSYYLYFFLCHQFLAEKKKRRLLFFTIVTSFMLVILQGLYQYFYHIDETIAFIRENSPHLMEDVRFQSRILSHKVFSTFIYSNTFAGYLILTIPVTAAIFFNRGRKVLKGFVISLFIMLCVSYLFLYVMGRPHLIGPAFFWGCFFPAGGLFDLWKTQSEGAYLCLAAGIFLALSVYLLKKKKYVLNGAFLGGLVIFLVISWGLLPRGKRDVISEKLGKSTLVRLEYYRAGVAMLSDSGFSGSGPGTFGIRYSRYKLAEAEETQLAHNVFLQLLVETGYPAAFAFLAFFLLILFYAFRMPVSRPEDRSELFISPVLFVAAFSAAFLHNIVDNDFYVPGYGFMLMFMAAFALSFSGTGQRQRQEDKKRPLLFVYLTVIFILAVCVMSAFSIHYLKNSLLAYQHYQAGRQFYQQGLMGKVMDEMKAAIDRDPMNDMYYYETARMLHSAGDLQMAEHFHAKAIELNPDKAYYHYDYACVMSKNDTMHEFPLRKRALDEMQEALRLYPTNDLYRKELQKLMALF